MIRIALNALGFQAGWCASTLGLSWGRPWLGPAIVSVVAAATLAREASWRRGALALLAVGCFGVAVDSALLLTGALGFPHPPKVWGAPVWFVPVFFTMWVNFALTLHVSLRWLRGRPVLAAALGAAAAPPTYLLAARLGAITIGSPSQVSLGLIAAGYALATPVAVWIVFRVREGAMPESQASGVLREAAA